MLDGLERTDRATELHTDLGVLDRHVEHIDATDLLDGERHGGKVGDGRRTSQPSPSAPMSVAGTPENSSFACLRVVSIVDRVARVRPSASGWTAKRLTPASLRAVTRIGWRWRRRGHSPSRRRGPSTVARVACIVMPPSSQRPLSSVKASVAGFHRRIAGRWAFWRLHHHCGAACWRRAPAREVRGAQQGAAHFLENDDLLDEADPGRRIPRGWRVLGGPSARPSGSRRPRRSPDRSPSACARRPRTTFPQGRSTKSRSWSCSSEKAKFMGGTVPIRPAGRQHHMRTPLYTLCASLE